MVEIFLAAKQLGLEFPPREFLTPLDFIDTVGMSDDKMRAHTMKCDNIGAITGIANAKI